MKRHRFVFWSLILLGVVGLGWLGARLRSIEPWMALARWEAVPLARLPELVRDRRVVVVGEQHAMVEPIDTARLLLGDTEKGVGFTHVALEWPISEQAEIDRYLAGDDTALESMRRKFGQTPGGTEEYFGVFTFIRELNRQHPDHAIAVRTVDVPAPIRDTPEEERDWHMFAGIEQILESNSTSRVLFYGGANHTAKCGRVEQKEILGARLYERYAEKMVSIRVLAPVDPMWQRMKREGLLAFGKPVVIPLTSHFPDPTRLFQFWNWHSDRPGMMSANAAYDYVVWWPTSQKGRRG